MMSCIYYFIIAELIQANMLLPVTHSTYNLSEPRIHASGVNLDDHRMLVMGGKGLNNLSSAMDVFDTRIQKWTTHTVRTSKLARYLSAASCLMTHVPYVLCKSI